MKTILANLHLIFLLMLSTTTYSQQNLVPNSSFESYSDCSSSPLIYFLNDWYIPVDGGSSDYFNSCINTVWPIMGVPDNSFGYQLPHTGNGYCGFGTYETDTTPIVIDAGEYLRVKLTESLENGRKYCLSFYISLSDSSSYESNTLYAFFSSIDTSVANSSSLLQNAQITFNIGFNVSKTDWIMLEGSFIAAGGEKYLTIGNFQTNSQINTMYLGHIQGYPEYAYYYIDDVLLIDSNSVPNPNVFITPNVFSPNGDGINDIFKITGLEQGDEVEIFNRWGISIYKSLQKNEGWDGRTTSGKECSEGVYFYIITSNTSERIKKGFIELIK